MGDNASDAYKADLLLLAVSPNVLEVGGRTHADHMLKLLAKMVWIRHANFYARLLHIQAAAQQCLGPFHL